MCKCTFLSDRLLTFSATGVPVELDRVLRQCLRDFPHIHSVLLKQLVSTLARVEPVRIPSLVCVYHRVCSIIRVVLRVLYHCSHQSLWERRQGEVSCVRMCSCDSPSVWLMGREKRNVLLVGPLALASRNAHSASW